METKLEQRRNQSLPQSDSVIKNEIRFRVSHSSGKTRVLRLVGPQIRFGCGADCEVRLQGEGVRDLHAELTRETDRYQLRGFDQPLLVSGHETAESVLAPGDWFQIGNYEFTLLASATEQDAGGDADPSTERPRRLAFSRAFQPVIPAGNAQTRQISAGDPQSLRSSIPLEDRNDQLYQRVDLLTQKLGHVASVLEAEHLSSQFTAERQAAQMSAALEAERAEKARLQQAVAELTENVHALQQRAVEAERQASEAQREVVDAQQRAAAAEKESEDSQQRAAEAEHRVVEARERAEAAEKRAEEAQQQADQAERRAEEAQQLADAAELRAEESARLMTEADKRADAAERIAGEEKAKATETGLQLQKAESLLSQLKTEREQDKEGWEQESGMLQEQLQSTSTELAQARAQIDDLERARQAAESTIEELQAETEQLREDLQQTAAELEQANETQQTSTSQQKVLESQLETQLSELNQTRQELEETKRSLTKLNDKLNASDTALAEVQQAARAKEAELEQRIEDAKRESEAIQDNFQNLQTQREELQTSLQKVQSDFQATKSQLQEKEERLGTLESELTATQSQLRESERRAEAKTKELEERTNHALQELEGAYRELAELQNGVLPGEDAASGHERLEEHLANDELTDRTDAAHTEHAGDYHTDLDSYFELPDPSAEPASSAEDGGQYDVEMTIPEMPTTEESEDTPGASTGFDAHQPQNDIDDDTLDIPDPMGAALGFGAVDQPAEAELTTIPEESGQHAGEEGAESTTVPPTDELNSESDAIEGLPDEAVVDESEAAALPAWFNTPKTDQTDDDTANGFRDGGADLPESGSAVKGATEPEGTADHDDEYDFADEQSGEHESLELERDDDDRGDDELLQQAHHEEGNSENSRDQIARDAYENADREDVDSDCVEQVSDEQETAPRESADDAMKRWDELRSATRSASTPVESIEDSNESVHETNDGSETNEVPESAADILARLGQSVGEDETLGSTTGADVDPADPINDRIEAGIAEEGEPRTAQMIAESAMSEVSRGAEGDDNEDSIEAYMNRLLARVGGEEGSLDAKVSEAAAGLAPPLQDGAEGSSIEDLQLEPLSDADFAPRSHAPEKGRDLAAMRELANSSARSAIQSSNRRRIWARAGSKMVISAVALLTSVGLMVFSGFTFGFLVILAGCFLTVSIVWGADAVLTMKKISKEQKEASSEN